MSEKNIQLTSDEQSTLAEVLFEAKKSRIKHKEGYQDIDHVIDKVTDRVTLKKRTQQKSVNLFDGITYNTIYKGGRFESEHGAFIIEEIHDDTQHIKVNGNWHHKGEFEPAQVIQPKVKGEGYLR